MDSNIRSTLSSLYKSSIKTSFVRKGNSCKKNLVVGCNVCKKDDDHAKLLLCEMCNDEYHFYCLDPPLKAVPDGDFFCGMTSFISVLNVLYDNLTHNNHLQIIYYFRTYGNTVHDFSKNP